ncbi:hypothetical protein [Nitrospirillum amazonense]|uniref:Lipoprotein n=1 Tax=Nitrospirillum amazonense TaxID=28077 RepID=A0A560K252_9PROT|nr:hypothetical protein [Nitrospirillum amazonense]MDG3443831.1 hypothetical protein [Nitrospirillum amazonense]TWB77391.1 hypothetical protein FBZ87_103208 [Nitrospirillum amazonense]
MRTNLIMGAVALLVLAGCAATGQGTGGSGSAGPGTNATPAELFARSLNAAAVARPDLIGPELVRIVPDAPQASWAKLMWRDGPHGRQVLVASTMATAAYEKYYAGKAGGTSPDSWGTMWVTAVPQLQEFCAGATGDAAAKTERVKQYLGLDPSRDYSEVVEMWVAPEALARPCPDTDVTAAHCTLDTSSTAARPTCTAGDAACLETQGYWDWFARNMRVNYVEGGAPWTRLGYTYDWHPQAGGSDGAVRYGASEFILKPSRPYDIRAAYTLADYCRKPAA